MLEYKEIPWRPPEQLFAPFSKQPWSILLHSARLDAQFGRYSFMGLDPFKTITHEKTSGTFFDDLKKSLSEYVMPIIPELPPLQGGVLGLWGYELLHETENLPTLDHATLPFPDAVLGFYDTIIAFDNQLKKTWLISTGFPELNPIARKQRAIERLEWLEKECSFPVSCRGLGMPSPRARHASPLHCPKEQIMIQSNFTSETYQTAVQQTIDAILAGDFFEANISQQFQLDRPADFEPWDLYLSTLKYNAAPFSVFFKTPYGTLISASPERFLLCQNNQVTTCPIKGTRPRNADPKTDQQLAAELLNSEKDRAENIMIVDLMRNDLSKVCNPHTVQVSKLCELESFTTVHHLVSTIHGTLKENITTVDLLKACFPGGSITGAPKVEVLKHIQKIEKVRRGPYCGSLGYIAFNGNLDTSIVIRTYTITSEKIYFQTGGAITLDSIPAEEYQETLDKAYGLIKALKEK